MTWRVGVGRGSGQDSVAVGREAARAALVPFEGRLPQLALVFSGIGHDHAALIGGISDVTGDAALAGCTTAGVITQRGSDENPFAVAVLAVAGAGLTVRTVLAENASADLPGAAAQIAAAAHAHAAKMILLLPDGLTINATRLLAALTEALAPGISVLGGAAGDNSVFLRSFQYERRRVVEGGVVAVLLGGALELDVEVTHGCALVGLEHVVTKAHAGVVAEIDHRPAWNVLSEYLDRPQGLSAQAVPYLCVAQKLPAGAGTYGDHVIRVPLGLDEKTGAVFFPGELGEGERVNMVRRDPDQVARSAVAAAERIRARHPGRRPALVLQFDCAGRGSVLFGQRVSERLIDPIQRVFGKDVGWIGFHSFGEIAPIAGRSYYHNYTMALGAIYEGDER
jgi:hypothetical protein